MIETVRTFTALSEEFVELSMQHDPVAATGAGIHDYDATLPDDSPEGLAARAAWLRDLDQRLVASVPWDELPAATRVDFALLRSRIASQRADLEEIHVPQRTPALFLRRAFLGVHLLLANRTTPLEERKDAVVARLMAIPDYLAAAQRNLQQVPPVLLEHGLTLATNGPGFVDDVVRQLMRRFPQESERLEHAGSRARLGFLRFHDHLDREMRAQAGGTFAIGERWMNHKLEREHLLPWDCAELEALGREQLERIRGELEAEARRLDPARSWREHLAEGLAQVPDPNWLTESYLDEIARARRFVAEHRLAPLPAGERLEIADTPPFQRGYAPWTTYQAPAAFDADSVGTFCITPVDLRRGEAEQRRQLEGHCLPRLPLTVVHELWPGHHLQRVHAHEAATRLRRLASSELFLEGWALHAESVMHDHGYFTHPLTRLFQLRHRLWRACRVVLDTALHTGRMSLEEGVALLEREVGLERAHAMAEVHRTCLQPTRMLGGLVGALLLEELEQEVRGALGERFTLLDFHAAVLAGGSLPITLVREDLVARWGFA